MNISQLLNCWDNLSFLFYSKPVYWLCCSKFNHESRMCAWHLTLRTKLNYSSKDEFQIRKKKKNTIKSDCVCIVFWSEREHMLSQTSFAFDTARSRRKRTQHKPTIFKQTTQAVNLFLGKKDRGKTPLKCYNLIAIEHCLFFSLNNYSLLQSSQDPTTATPKFCHAGSSKKQPRSGWNMSHSLTLVDFTEGIWWIFLNL